MRLNNSTLILFVAAAAVGFNAWRTRDDKTAAHIPDPGAWPFPPVSFDQPIVSRRY